MGEKVFEGKEKMVQDWSRVMLAIIRAQSGASDIKHKLDDNGNVIGLTAELEIQLEEAVSIKTLTDYDGAVKIAQEQMADTVTKEGEFTAKQRLLIDWVSMRNAILRAQSGEMKVGTHRNKRAGNLVVGLSAELDINFAGATQLLFTDDEKKSIDDAKT